MSSKSYLFPVTGEILTGTKKPPRFRINHQVIGPVYTLFFCVNTWLAWQAVRHKLYPFPNGLFAALAMTGWYLTEITGEISNIQIVPISGIAFNLVWIFYSANVILVALSGYRRN